MSAGEQFMKVSEIPVDVDHRGLVSRANISYFSPTTRSEAGLPVGNGVVGSLVWTTNNSLNLQVNRVDVFAQDSYSQSGTDYCGGCGKIEVDFHNPVFKPDKSFKEHLSVYDGLVTILGDSVRVEVFAWSEDDVIAIRINDKRENPLPITVNLGMLRPYAINIKTKDHRATSTFHEKNDKIFLVQEFSEKEFFCRSVSGVGVVGRKSDRKRSGIPVIMGFPAYSVVEPGSGPFTILISTCASFDPDKDIITEMMNKLEVATKTGFEKMFSQNEAWWSKFWKKSFLHLHSADGVADFLERCHTYHMYLMASSSRGKFPAKSNGMLWNTNGDERDWGAHYWVANTSQMYRPLFAANHLELTDPYFGMYSGMLGKAKIAARQRWGSKGIYLPEAEAFNGPEVLPQEVADTFRKILLGELPYDEMSESFRTFGNSKNYFSQMGNMFFSGQRWAWVTEIVSCAAELGIYYWQRFEFTGDEKWLREKAYPMIRGAVEFYRNFPNMKKESDGIYHIHDTNAHECVWGVKDSIVDLAAIRGVAPLAIRASEILGIDEDLRPKWQEFLDNLAVYPIGCLEVTLKTKAGEHIEWAGVRKEPISNENGRNTWLAGSELSATDLSKSTCIQGRYHGHILEELGMVVAPVLFRDWTLETEDELMNKVAQATYQTNHRRKSVLEGIGRPKVTDILAVVAAMMGQLNDLKILLPAVITSISESILPNGLSLAEGSEAMTCEHAGTVSYALQEAQLQSVPPKPGGDPVIHLYPAWPKSWDSQFSLLARGSFLITSEFKKGKVQFVGIKSLLGKKCLMRNPWSGPVDVYRNGKHSEELSNELLDLPTVKGESILIFPRGKDTTSFQIKVAPVLDEKGVWQLDINIGGKKLQVTIGKY